MRLPPCACASGVTESRALSDLGAAELSEADEEEEEEDGTVGAAGVALVDAAVVVDVEFGDGDEAADDGDEEGVGDVDGLVERTRPATAANSLPSNKTSSFSSLASPPLTTSKTYW